MNTKTSIVAASLLFALCSCSKHDSDVNAASRPSQAPTKTAFDQKENKADLALTQEIRKALMDDSSLSTSAKNVTVVSQNGIVTLGGTVAVADEKARIGEKAEAIAGAGRVVNQINVQPH